jgi:VanZ family protein
MDKVAHFCLYAGLGFLMRPTTSRRGLLLAACALLAGLDECWQGFIPGRYMDWMDWTADITGALAGAFFRKKVFR